MTEVTTPERERTDGSEPPTEIDDTGPRPTYTIDELSSVTGIPSRTIRFYQSKGALPPPARQGRIAVYEDLHRDRLRLIAELQDRGLRLDAIRDLLGEIESGAFTLDDWLGLGDQLRAPWSEDRPHVFTEEEIERALGDRRPGLLADLVRVHAVIPQGDALPPTYLVPSPALMLLARRLEDAGIDTGTSAGSADVIRRHLRKASDDLVDFFSSRAGRGFGGTGEPKEIAAAFSALRPIASEAVRVIFAQEIERALHRYVDKGGVQKAAEKARKHRKD